MMDITLCKRIQDSLGFRIPGTGCQFLYQWNLSVGFRIPRAVFRIPNPKFPDSTRKNIRINFSDSGIWTPLHRGKVSSKPDSPSNFTTCLQHLPSSHLNNSLNPPLPYPSHCLAHTRSSFTRFCDTYLEGSIFISVQNKITRSVIIIIPKVEIKWLYRSICTCYKRKSQK